MLIHTNNVTLTTSKPNNNTKSQPTAKLMANGQAAIHRRIAGHITSGKLPFRINRKGYTSGTATESRPGSLWIESLLKRTKVTQSRSSL